MEQESHEYKLSLAVNEAMTLIQMAAKEIEGGDDVCLKEQRAGLEAINDDIAAAEFAKDMAELESDDDIKVTLEEQAVYMLSVASAEIKNVTFKTDHFYELAELNAAIKLSYAEKIMNDAFEVNDVDMAELVSVKNRAGGGGGSVMNILFYIMC